MVVTVDSPFIAPPRISRELFMRVLSEAGSPWAARGAELYELIRGAGHDPAVYLAIAAKEHTYGANRDSVLWRNDTNSWTNARSVRDPSLTGWSIIRDAVRGSNYVRYADVADSLRDGMYRITDPTHSYVRGGRTTIGQVFAIWTEGDGPEYAAFVVERINRWMGEDTGSMATPYEHIIPGIVDLRPVLKTNPRGGSEGRLPLAQKRGIVIHFNGPDVGRDDRQHIINVATYHCSKDFSANGSGAIGDGIQYHLAVADDGVVYLLRDLECGLWHSGSSWNRHSFAVYVPIGINQRATAVQREKLGWVVDRLRAFTGEGRSAVKGHQDLSSTNCPGSLMSDFVRPYRAGSDRPVIVEPGPTVSMPGAQLDPWRNDEAAQNYARKWNGGQPFWLLHPFADWLHQRGGLACMGHVVSGAFVPAETGLLTQFFEGGALEYHPGNAPEHRVLRRHTGLEVLRARHPERVPA